MNGVLHKTSDMGWVVKWSRDTNYNGKVINYLLHPDDFDLVENMYKSHNDGTEDRFNTFPFVTFKVVYNHKMSGVIEYAKLIINEKDF